jgi:hypothetical protein
MIKIGSVAFLGAFLLAGLPVAAESTNSAPPFAEVYELLQKNLTGTTPAELNRTAVEGLLRQLNPKASLDQPGIAASNRVGVVRTNVFDSTIAYLRLDSLRDTTAANVRAALAGLSKSNKLAGVVLDLRYAEGENYPGAAALADIFIKREMPLLEWEGATIKSKADPGDLSLPVALVINRNTSGPAEVAAALIREAGAGLLIGSQTSGNASITKAFTLSNGARLRIAVAPVRFADGQTLGSQGLAPDIAVSVSPEEERAYYTDAYRALSRLGSVGEAALASTAAGTNRPPRRRYSEAELVRDRREGVSPDTSARSAEPETPVVSDPPLARAIDLLKGLAVVRSARP